MQVLGREKWIKYILQLLTLDSKKVQHLAF